MTNDIDAAIAAEQEIGGATPAPPQPEPRARRRRLGGHIASIPEAEQGGTPAPPPVDPDMPPLQERLARASTHFLALDRLRESPTNPRQLFPEAGLEALADDIRKHTVLEPLLVRFTEGAGKPDGAGAPLEIVFGARRFRAAQRAGLVEVPVRMAEITDLEVIELQLAENNQREDLHPLEEADAYDNLHRKHGLSVQQIADKYAVGKSASYVYARMKLCAIKDKGAREAFLEGRIDASTALLVARVPNEKLQREYAKRVLEGRDYAGQPKQDEPLSYREALDVYHREFMLRLADAPFDKGDAGLVPAAGACTTCPKRTGNQAELFADVQSADVCTDTVCFSAKREAHAARLIAEAKKKGQVVLQGKAAKTANPGSGNYMPGHVNLDETCYEDPKRRTYKALLADQLKANPDGDAELRPQLLVREHGDVLEVLPKKEAARALKDAGHKFGQRSSSSSSSRSTSSRPSIDTEKARKAQLAQEVAELLENTAVEQLAALAEKDKATGKVLELYLQHGPFSYIVGQVLKRRGIKSKLATAGLKEPRLRSVFLEVALTEDAENSFSGEQGPLMRAAAKAYGLDLAKLEKEIRGRLEEKVPAPAPKTGSGQKAANVAKKKARGK